MTTEMTQSTHNGLPVLTFNRDQVDLIKRTVCKGATDDELALFLHACKRTGLDPLVKQIHAVKRWNSKEQREEMALQVSIDGFRLIAARTKRYAPGKEPTFVHENGALVSATSYVKFQAEDGSWHDIAATAYYAEYVQTTKEGKPTHMWAKMPHNQLAKCAESLALRRAFPVDLSGVYTDEEMEQASVPPAEVVREGEVIEPTPKTEGPRKITDAQRKRFYAIWKNAKRDELEVKAYLKAHFGSENSADITVDGYESTCQWAQSLQPNAA